MRGKIVAGLVCALSLVAAAASAHTTLGWYIAADVGAHDMEKEKLFVRDVTLVSHTETPQESSSSSSNEKVVSGANQLAITDINEDSSYTLDTHSKGAAFIRAGNQLTPNWRAEIEYGQRPGDIRTGIAGDYSSDSEDDSSAGRGTLDITTVMFNVLYDIAPERKLHPYIGAGLGVARVETDYTGAYVDPNYSETYSIHEKKTVGAYQLIAGLAWSVSEHLNVDLTYRYLELQKRSYGVRVDTSYYDYYDGCGSECDRHAPTNARLAPANADYYGTTLIEDTYDAHLAGKLRDHSLTIGLRWAFGAPAAPVEPVTSSIVEPESNKTPADYSSPGPVVAPIAPSARRDFTVYFPFNSAMPTADGQAIMADAARQATSEPGAPVSVTGHADTSGGAAYNVKLSQKRARMVADGLIQLGVPASAVTTDWKGEADLAVPTGDGVKNAENRRATIHVGQ